MADQEVAAAATWADLSETQLKMSISIYLVEGALTLFHNLLHSPLRSHPAPPLTPARYTGKPEDLTSRLSVDRSATGQEETDSDNVY